MVLFVSKKVDSEGWGNSTVEELSEFIRKNEPGIKGFTPRNIWRMKQIYETYSKFPKLSPLVTENKNLATVLRDIHPAAENVFKDKYVLDFLDLPEHYSEKDLQKALVVNLKDFILELGKDFTFVDQEYRLQVGNHDYFIDLLFYHRELCCLVAFELKINDFKPEYLGKINFYLEALDRDVKKEYEKPSVGVLLCKTKDEEVVEYALSRSLSPALVAEYETKLIDKQLLKTKLQEFYDASKEEEQ